MPSTRTRRGASRGAPMLRLRIGFVLIAIVLSFFGARLVQLQGVDPRSYAVRWRPPRAPCGCRWWPSGATSSTATAYPLADSIKGKMVIADPDLTADRAPELARLLSDRLSVDYFRTLTALRGREEGSRYEYVARRVPSTLASDTLAELDEAGFNGISLQDDPIRDYPAGDVAANLLGYMGTDEPLGGFERTFDKQLAGVDGEATWQSNSGKGVRIPLRESTLKAAHNGAPLRTTIDRDLQWFTQKVLAQSVRQYRAESGAAVVMDTRTGEILALADVPTFDANAPTEADEDDLGSRAMSDTYEPGSVEKVLTAASLIDAGKAFPRQRFKVPPSLARQDRVIGDWFDHGNIRLTLAGIIAKSSNIGTVLAADAFSPVELVAYLQKFGLGQRTDVGVRGETPGILTPGEVMTSQTKDRVAFGQSLSVNVAQMAAAVNTVANGGVRVSPSLIAGSAVTDDGVTVGTDVATRTRVVSKQAATRDRPHDGEGRRPRGRRRARRAGARLPRGRQDRHRPAGRQRRHGLRRQHLGVLRRLRAGRRRPLHGLRRGPRTQGRRRWRLDRRARVLPDHGLRPGPLRRRADQRHAVAPARRVVTRYPRSVHEPESATRPQQSPSTPATELADWLSALTEVAVHGDLAVTVSGISLSTARVRPGDLYAALPGARAHGADFAAQAVAAGAVVVLTDPAGLDRLPPATPALVVTEPRRVLGRLAARIYGDPAAGLRVIGVTGTQGKTTTTRVLEQGLTEAGVTSAVIGTVGTRIAGEDVKTQLTTPEAPDLHGLFAVMRERGVDTCAMEVSSHALVLGRVDGVVFDVATFLNLGRDHLDFHADLDDYFAAKAGLFTPERARVGLTNVDDEFGRRLLDVAGIPMSTYSSPRSRRRLAGGRRRPDGRGRELHGPRPRRRAAHADPRAGRVQRLQRAGRHRLGGARRARPATGGRRHRPRRRGAGSARAGLRRPGLHRRRRLRPQARRPRGGARHAATAHRRPGRRRGGRRRRPRHRASVR